MKKTILVALFFVVTGLSSAGFVLDVGGVDYSPGSTISLTQGVHTFNFNFDTPFIQAFLLTLKPISAAHFDLGYIILPMDYSAQIIPNPDPDGYDVWQIMPNPYPSPPSPSLIEVKVFFNGPAAEFAVWDLDFSTQSASWSLVPEPATFFLLGLGGLALRKNWQ